MVRGIDGPWLDRLAREDPVHHAYAVWDREHHPDKIEFCTLREEGAPVAYLLIWRGRGHPIVHWNGTARDPRPLLEALPLRPLLAVVPERLAPEVERCRGPASIQGVLLMTADRDPGNGHRRPSAGRPLTRADVPRLQEFASATPDPIAQSYAGADPAVDRVYGVMEGGRLVSVARIQASTPGCWVIGGVFTLPEARNHGYATEATGAAVADARAAGARPALYVRETNLPARRAYGKLGFVPLERRSWVEAGVRGDPPAAS